MISKSYLAIILAAVVVVAGVSAYFVLNREGGEKESDYTLLGDEDKIKEGLTIKVTSEGFEAGEATMVVKQIKDGIITYETEGTVKLPEEEKSLSSFVLPFDYVTPDESLTDLKIEHNGNTYTLNGEAKEETSGVITEYKFEKLKIILGSENKPQSVDGKMSEYISVTNPETKVETIYHYTHDYKTSEDKLLDTCEMYVKQSDSVNKSEFYGKALSRFSDSEFSDVKDVKSEKYGNVNVDVYTVNGTFGGSDYKDTQIYVYNDFVLKTTGTIDGIKSNQVFSIYYA